MEGHRGSVKLTKITYLGTIEEWNNINSHNWNYEANITEIICSDGVISLN